MELGTAIRGPPPAPRKATATREGGSESRFALYGPAEWLGGESGPTADPPTRCGRGYVPYSHRVDPPVQLSARRSNGSGKGWVSGRRVRRRYPFRMSPRHGRRQCRQCGARPAGARGGDDPTTDIHVRPPCPVGSPPAGGSRRRGLERRSGSPVTACPAAVRVSPTPYGSSGPTEPP